MWVEFVVGSCLAPSSFLWENHGNLMELETMLHIAMYYSVMVYNVTSHKSLVFCQYTQELLGEFVYTKKIQVTSGIFHGIP